MSDLWAKKKPPDSLIIFFMSKWPQKIVQVELKNRSEGGERSYADASYTAYARIMSRLWADYEQAAQATQKQ